LDSLVVYDVECVEVFGVTIVDVEIEDEGDDEPLCGEFIFGGGDVGEEVKFECLKSVEWV
jgi:hypothetical protein